MNNTAPTNPTPASLALFDALAKDAKNWSGTPLIYLTSPERGNLTNLKRNGLLVTFNSDGDMFADFTDAGIALAASRGITL
jgi:hypothetical protein